MLRVTYNEPHSKNFTNTLRLTMLLPPPSIAYCSLYSVRCRSEGRQNVMLWTAIEGCSLDRVGVGCTRQVTNTAGALWSSGGVHTHIFFTT
jgi:hypothetical protein